MWTMFTNDGDWSIFHSVVAFLRFVDIRRLWFVSHNIYNKIGATNDIWKQLNLQDYAFLLPGFKVWDKESFQVRRVYERFFIDKIRRLPTKQELNALSVAFEHCNMTNFLHNLIERWTMDFGPNFILVINVSEQTPNCKCATICVRSKKYPDLKKALMIELRWLIKSTYSWCFGFDVWTDAKLKWNGDSLKTWVKMTEWDLWIAKFVVR